MDVCLVNLPGGVGEGRRGQQHDETADETFKTSRIFFKKRISLFVKSIVSADPPVVE